MPEISSQAATPAQQSWPLATRVIFRFAFIYWVLDILPSRGTISLIDLLPWGWANNKITTITSWPLNHLAQFVGTHFFYLSGRAAEWHETGSGDTALNYMVVLCIFMLALAGATLWSAIDEARGRREYRAAYAWLRLFLRFTLALTLIGYGYAKVFSGQFGLAPDLWQLNERYGDSSPMHVLWFFMGVSRPYTIFGGLMEVIPGFLLLFRRTSTIGLLGAIAVMTNVVVLNFTYDVPVKIYSTNILLMALFLLLPDMLPMWRFFVEREPSKLTGVWLPPWERKPLRIGAYVLQGYVVLACIIQMHDEYQSRAQAAEASPLRGVWQVSTLQGWTEQQRPLAIVLDDVRSAFFDFGDGKRTRFPTTYDGKTQTIRFPKQKEESHLHWAGPDGVSATLDGTWMGKPVQFGLTRTNPAKYPLMTRGFHWVQEDPFNR